jgi:hypothetical protein
MRALPAAAQKIVANLAAKSTWRLAFRDRIITGCAQQKAERKLEEAGPVLCNMLHTNPPKLTLFFSFLM